MRKLRTLDPLRHKGGLVVAAALGLALGCADAKAGGMYACGTETRPLYDLVVSVVEGSGDVAAEQARWSHEDVYHQDGLYVGNEYFFLESVGP